MTYYRGTDGRITEFPYGYALPDANHLNEVVKAVNAMGAGGPIFVLTPEQMETPAACQAALDEHPGAIVYVPPGAYVWDMLTYGEEVRPTGGTSMVGIGVVTVTSNNPVIGVILVDGTDGSCIDNIGFIGDFGVDIAGQERPNTEDWPAALPAFPGDPEWVAWRAEWVAWGAAWNARWSIPYGFHPPLDTNLSFREAWEAALGTPVNQWFGSVAGGRNCAVYVVNTNRCNLNRVRTLNFHVGVFFRGVSLPDDPQGNIQNYGNSITNYYTEYTDQGILYQQQKDFSWDVIFGYRGSDIRHAEQHVIYNTDNTLRDITSNSSCGRAHAWAWESGDPFKFKHSRLDTPFALSMSGCQTLVNVGEGCSGVLGSMYFDDQKMSPYPEVSGGNKAAIDIRDCPDLVWVSPPMGTARPSAPGAEQDPLFFMNVERCNGLRLPDGWRYTFTGLAGAAAPAGFALHFKVCDDAYMGAGVYTDLGATNRLAMSLSGDSGVGGCNRCYVAPSYFIGTTKAVDIVHETDNCIITMDPSLFQNAVFNDNTTVRFLGTGLNNILRRQGGSVVVSPQAAGFTVTDNHTGYVFTNADATGMAVFPLPQIGFLRGLVYTFYVLDADGIRVQANTNDKIRINTDVSAGAGKIESTTIGSSVTLVSVDAEFWVATAFTGTWVVT